MKIFELSTVDMTLYKFVIPLMKELRRNGFEVVCGAKDCGYLEKIREEGFPTYDIGLRRSLNPIALAKGLFQLVRILRIEKVDILHVHTPIAAMVGRLAACLARVDVTIYTVHGFILQPKVYYYIEKFMAKFLTRYMFTVNQEDCDFAINHHFMAANRIWNINSVGIDTVSFDPAIFSEETRMALRKSLNIDSTVPVIGFVGRLVRSKGVLDLIHAFLEVRKQYPCQLVLVGPWDMNERADEAIISEIEQLVADHNLLRDICLLGSREDVADLLNIMDVFVLPSYREGMPVSLLEAMAMEKAVIGTNIRGVREEITAESGLIYEPKDVNGLVEQLLFYLHNETQRTFMGRNARVRVLKHFSQDRVIERQMKVFLECQSQKKG